MRYKKLLILVLIVLVAAILLYQIPAVQARLVWGYIQAEAYLRGVLHPIGAVPTPARTGMVATLQLTPSMGMVTMLQPTPSTGMVTMPQQPTETPIPLPESVYLQPPAWERQDINGCGPATLSMYLNYYGWEGDQYDIGEQIKPDRADRNVNVEELAYFTWNYAGWLQMIYRVGGDVELLKALIASGIPVMIEEGDELSESYWPGDDLWAGHFLLLTGYDDALESFYAQDSFRQADRLVSYADTDRRWKPFNRVYLLIYLPHQEETVRAVLGEQWDVDANRTHALQTAQAEIAADPQDALAWFNLGSNQVYFEEYATAADSYDQARTIGLPQRMLRYQFGPFHAYFQTNRYQDLFDLAEYALIVTPNSEEAFLWKGWALYNLGDPDGAIAAFKKAYRANPKSFDAQYALGFMGVEP